MGWQYRRVSECDFSVSVCMVFFDENYKIISHHIEPLTLTAHSTRELFDLTTDINRAVQKDLIKFRDGEYTPDTI